MTAREILQDSALSLRRIEMIKIATALLAETVIILYIIAYVFQR